MSAPESSNSKAPPSLLYDKPKGADGNSSRILANLEGRVAPPADQPRRSRAPLAVVALLLIVAGGWAAWHMQQRGQTGTVASAAQFSAGKATVAAAASGGAQVVAKAAASATSAATIIADDSDNKAAAVSRAASAGDPGDNRLSRALADGAEPGGASAAVVAGSGASVPSTKHSKNATTVASQSKHEAATAHGKHANAPAIIAQTKKPRAVAKNGNESKDDPDADLLAALVARTKPADSKGTVSNAATKVSATTAINPTLAERVKDCGQRGFFEDQLCRWRVCDGHWGKDAACPGAAPQARQP